MQNEEKCCRHNTQHEHKEEKQVKIKKKKGKVKKNKKIVIGRDSSKIKSRMCDGHNSKAEKKGKCAKKSNFNSNLLEKMDKENIETES